MIILLISWFYVFFLIFAVSFLPPSFPTSRPILWLLLAIIQQSENEDHGIWSHHFMANRGRNNGNSERLYFWGSKITADGDCSHEIKRYLLLGRKAMTNLVSMLKSRDITLPTKVHTVKAIIFPVVIYGCESWTMKKAEHRRMDAFELWCWGRFFRVPWTAGDQTSQS